MLLHYLLKQKIRDTILDESQIQQVEFALAKYGSYLANEKVRKLAKAIYVDFEDLAKSVAAEQDDQITHENALAFYNACTQIQAFEIVLAAADLFRTLAKHPLATKVINATFIQYLNSVEQGMLEFLYNHGCSDQLGLDFVMGYAENPEHPIKLHGATLARISEVLLERHPDTNAIRFEELKQYNWFRISEEDAIACPHDRPTFGLATGPTGVAVYLEAATTSTVGNIPPGITTPTTIYGDLVEVEPGILRSPTFDQAQAAAFLDHPEVVHVETDPEALRAQIALKQNISAQEIQPVARIKSTLEEQVAEAKQSVSTWPEEKKENVQLEGLDPHNSTPTFFEVLAAKAAIEQQG